MGRRSIPIQPIRDERNRAVTFVKRKAGLFKKAHELSVLCQVDIALVIVGSNGKIFEFSSSSVDDVMKRYKKTEVQEFKTTTDFSANSKSYHKRTESSNVGESDDEDDEIASKEEPSAPDQQQPPQTAPGQYPYYYKPGQPGPQVAQPQISRPTVQQSAPPDVAVQQPSPQPLYGASAGSEEPVTEPMARPKLKVQIPITQEQKTQPVQSQWTPQRLQATPWGPGPGISPTGPYYAPMNDLQRIQLASNGDPTPISTSLPSKYMSDAIQSPSNFFTSEWGVPWSANPNSGFIRPGTRHVDLPTAQAVIAANPQQQQLQLQLQLQQQQQRSNLEGPRQGQIPPGYQIPPNAGLYGGGMPSAGVQSMFQSSPVQFTPSDTKRKAEDQLGTAEGPKKQQF